jgi:hypothetical protein
MFLELQDPQVLDRIMGLDYAGFRVREKDSPLRYWVVFKFKGTGNEGREKALRFLRDALEKLESELPGV